MPARVVTPEARIALTRWAISPEMKATSREPIELRPDHGTLAATRGGEGGGELWPAVERMGALAALCLYEFGCEGEAFRLGEAPHCLSLCIDSEARAPLPFG